MRLLNPGPVSLSVRVKAALCAPDECHREPSFARLVDNVRDRLREPGYTPALLAGSGTAAVECMLSVVARGDRTLVLANGVYGERIAKMLTAQNKPHDVLAAPWTSEIDLLAVEEALKTGRYRWVAVVHHETTTGRLNRLDLLGALCTRFDVPMLVDAVSSYGAEEIRLAEWNIEAMAATANKCLHGAPGISFVLVRDTALGRPSGATSLYLDVHQHANAMPFTLPTHVMRAFHVALVEHEAEGGWRARRRVYRARMKRVVQAIDLPLLLEEDANSSCLVSFRLGEETYDAFHARLREAGFIVYAGQGNLGGQIVRIAVMGDLAESDLRRLERALAPTYAPASIGA